MSIGIKRSKQKHITVFEYGLLSSHNKARKVDKVKQIPHEVFEYLKKCCLCDVTESRFLKMKIAYGMEVLQIQNYAGVVLCPDGTQIEILPKIVKHSSTEERVKSEEQARLSLLMMLRSLRQFRHIETNETSIKKQKMPLMEIFIGQFLSAVNSLIKKGIKSDYVRVQRNSAFLKGKLLHSEQLKHNIISRHKFYVEYDAYLMDRAENRLIHSALAKVASYSNDENHLKLMRELLFAFAQVPHSSNVKNDFSQIRLQRGMKHYEAPISWSRLILEGFSPQSMSGENNAYSLLFPMEAVFESYVAKYLKQNAPRSLKLSAQVQSQSLVTYGGKKYFRLKPDLYLKELSGDDTVLDTKWKLLDQHKKSGKDKFGLSQDDFYQMLGYGYKYLNSKGRLVLIYPKTENFQKPLEHSFCYDEHHTLTLRVVPFDVSHQVDQRIDLSLLGIDSK